MISDKNSVQTKSQSVSGLACMDAMEMMSVT